jgi:hypothetical protein
VDAELKFLVRGVVLVTRALVAVCVGVIVLLAVATLARPEAQPCRDTVSDIPVPAVPMCVTPTADTWLVLTSAAGATLLTWAGGGVLHRRLRRS